MTFGSKLETLEESAFYRCLALSAAGLPNTVSKIGDRAFEECTALRDLTLGTGLKSVGSGAFSNCKSIAALSLPNGLVSIGESAFSGCEGFESLSVPDSVTQIGMYAFRGCRGLKTLVFPKNLQQVERGLFMDCAALHSVTFPAGVQDLGESTFWCCASLTSVSIPDTATVVRPGVFAYTGITEITVPQSVETIGTGAFQGAAALKKVTLPEALQLIAYGAFQECSALEQVDYKGTAAQWSLVEIQDKNSYLLEAKLTVKVSTPCTGAHNYRETVILPTCEKGGQTNFFCLNCGHSYEGDFVPAKDHEFVDWHVYHMGMITAGCKNGCGESVVLEPIGIRVSQVPKKLLITRPPGDWRFRAVSWKRNLRTA